MGYCVNIAYSNVIIKNEHKPEILSRWKDMNSSQYDHLKGGGSWSGGKKTQAWYSWMDHDYDKTVTSVEDVLKMMGFSSETDEKGNIKILYYDSKTGQEDLFFAKIADLISSKTISHEKTKDGSNLEIMEPKQIIKWHGEDGDEYIWNFSNGELKNQDDSAIVQDPLLNHPPVIHVQPPLIENSKPKSFKNQKFQESLVKLYLIFHIIFNLNAKAKKNKKSKRFFLS